jgi:hypothetical protein
MGWSEIDNGSLLTAAEGNFDILITTDQSMRHQQNLAGRGLAILVLPTTSWPQIRTYQVKLWLLSPDFVLARWLNCNFRATLSAHPLHELVGNLEIGIDVLDIVVLVQALDKL